MTKFILDSCMTIMIQSENQLIRQKEKVKYSKVMKTLVTIVLLNVLFYLSCLHQ